jgi:hypothetical protein
MKDFNQPIEAADGKALKLRVLDDEELATVW